MSDDFDLDNDDGDNFDDMLSDFDDIEDDAGEPNYDGKPVKRILSKVKDNASSIASNKSDLVERIASNALPSSIEGLVTPALGVKDTLGEEISQRSSALLRESKPLLRKLDKMAPESGFIRNLVDKASAIANDDTGRYQEQSKSKQAEEYANETFGDSESDKTQSVIKEAAKYRQLTSSLKLQQSSATSLGVLAGFTTQVTSKYQRKSLELKYRSVLILKELTAHIKDFKTVTKKQLEATMINTSLPDFAKLRSTAALKQQFRQNITASISDKLYGDNNYIQNITDNLAAKANEKFGTIADAVSGLSDAAEQSESLGDVDKEDAAIGEGLNFGLNKALAGVRGAVEKQLGGKKLSKLDYINRSLPDVLETASRENGNEGFFGKYYKRGLGTLSELARPAGSSLDISEGGGLSAEDVRLYDTRSKISLMEVIPGYLSRILREVTFIGRGEDTELLRYSYSSRTFANESKIKGLVSRIISKSVQSNGLDTKLTDLISKIDPEGKLSDDERSKFSAALIKQAGDGDASGLGLLRKRGFFKGLDEDTEKKFSNVLSDFASKGDSYKNKSEFKEGLEGIRASIPNIREVVKDITGRGLSDTLVEMGIIKPDQDDVVTVDKDVLNSFYANVSNAFNPGESLTDPNTVDDEEQESLKEKALRLTKKVKDISEVGVKKGFAKLPEKTQKDILARKAEAEASINGVKKDAEKRLSDAKADLTEKASPFLERMKTEKAELVKVVKEMSKGEETIGKGASRIADGFKQRQAERRVSKEAATVTPTPPPGATPPPPPMSLIPPPPGDEEKEGETREVSANQNNVVLDRLTGEAALKAFKNRGKIAALTKKLYAKVPKVIRYPADKLIVDKNSIGRKLIRGTGNLGLKVLDNVGKGNNLIKNVVGTPFGRKRTKFKGYRIKARLRSLRGRLRGFRKSGGIGKLGEGTAVMQIMQEFDQLSDDMDKDESLSSSDRLMSTVASGSSASLIYLQSISESLKKEESRESLKDKAAAKLAKLKKPKRYEDELAKLKARKEARLKARQAKEDAKKGKNGEAKPSILSKLLGPILGMGSSIISSITGLGNSIGGTVMTFGKYLLGGLLTKMGISGIGDLLGGSADLISAKNGKAAGKAGKTVKTAKKAGTVGKILNLAKSAVGFAGKGGKMVGKLATGIKGGVGKIVSKFGGKALAKTGGKTLAKAGLKKLPGIGLLAGAAFAADRLMDGDIAGAGLEALSGILSLVPVAGTAGSVAVDVAIAERDNRKERSKKHKSQAIKMAIDFMERWIVGKSISGEQFVAKMGRLGVSLRTAGIEKKARVKAVSDLIKAYYSKADKEDIKTLSVFIATMSEDGQVGSTFAGLIPPDIIEIADKVMDGASEKVKEQVASDKARKALLNARPGPTNSNTTPTNNVTPIRNAAANRKSSRSAVANRGGNATVNQPRMSKRIADSGNYESIQLAKGAHISGMNPVVKESLIMMANEYFQATGKKLVVNSGDRTYEEQAALKKSKGRKAAKPGHSLHESGLVVDINTADADYLDLHGLMRKYGFTRPLTGETWHIEPALIQFDIDAAKKNPEYASKLALASRGFGGGGVGEDKNSGGSPTRNLRLAEQFIKNSSDVGPEGHGGIKELLSFVNSTKPEDAKIDIVTDSAAIAANQPVKNASDPVAELKKITTLASVRNPTSKDSGKLVAEHLPKVDGSLLNINKTLSQSLETQMEILEVLKEYKEMKKENPSTTPPVPNVQQDTSRGLVASTPTGGVSMARRA